MTFLLERFSSPTVQRCPDCGGRRTFVTGALIEADQAVALYLIHFYVHGLDREAFLTLSFGDHGIDPDPDADQPVTFAARFGEIEGTDGPSFSAVDAQEMTPSGDLYGRRLSRDDALSHPWIERLWDACDVLAEEVLLDHRNWPDGIDVVRRIRSRARHLLHRRR